MPDNIPPEDQSNSNQPEHEWQKAGGATATATRAARANPEAVPRSREDILTGIIHPLRAVDVVLATPDRSRANLAKAEALPPFILLLLLCSAIYTIPFGLVLGMDSWWKIGVFTLGSTAICIPSLYVFGSFIGIRSTSGQMTVIAMMLPAAAALFSAGFAPILAFLDATFDKSSDQVSGQDLGKILLTVSVLAGVLQLARILPRSRRNQDTPVLILLIPAWLVLLGYVMLRMVRTLHLFE